MTYLIILAVTILTIGSQMLVKQGVSNINAGLMESKFHYAYLALTSPYVLAAILLQGFGFVLWIFVVSKVKLGVAFALSGSFFYILMALSSWYFFGEQIKTLQWIGLFFISFGVVLLTAVN